MSLTMQAFHTRLFSAQAPLNTYLACLVELTQTSLAQIRVLKSDLEWFPW